MADDAGATGAVDDVHRLAEFLLHQRADDAGRGVGASAGAPGHHQGDGTGRESLCDGGRGKLRGEADAGGRDHEMAAREFSHSDPPLIHEAGWPGSCL